MIKDDVKYAMTKERRRKHKCHRSSKMSSKSERILSRRYLFYHFMGNNNWAMEESRKSVMPFEMGGYEMNQGNSFNNNNFNNSYRRME